MESRVAVVIISRLLHVVCHHFARRNVAVVDADATVGALIEDVIVVEKRLEVHLRGVVKHLVAVQTILVSRDGAAHHQLEDVGEEVHLRADGLHGIVETGVGVLGEVYLTIDIAAPRHVLVHRFLRGEGYLGAYAQTLVALLLLLCLLTTACRRLGCRHLRSEEGCKQYHYYFLHFSVFGCAVLCIYLLDYHFHRSVQLSCDAVRAHCRDARDVEALATRQLAECFALTF